MKTEVEPLEGNKVKLSVEVDQDEFESAIDEAFRRIGREVRVPGFRPGKVPRRVLEARIGRDAARQDALRTSLPDYYARAVRDHDLDTIAPPEIEITSEGDGAPMAFSAVVEVRPVVSIAGYQGLQVTVPSLDVTDEEVQRQIDRLRDTTAELADVSRPAREGDNVSIDITGYRHGERFEDLSSEDFLYQVGSGTITPALDEQLTGARTGDILKFNAEVGEHGEVSFQVLVKGVKEKVLPAVDDEWASEASEFDTVAELTEDIRRRLETVRKVQAAMSIRDAALEALVALVPDEAPDSMVEAQVERQLHDLAHRLESQGASLTDYLQATGQDQEAFLNERRAEAAQSVKADLALRALAEAEAIEVGDEDVESQIQSLAERYGAKPADLRRQLVRNDQMEELATDIRKSKAFAWLLEHVDVVDEEGRPVDRARLQLEIPGEGADADAGDPAASATSDASEAAPAADAGSEALVSAAGGAPDPNPEPSDPEAVP
ncbi:MAG TPA: trigger factor [Acidimicrobiales bacterium]|nr:trigger factor [Acidimicrobiales bacterium]